MSLMRSLGLFVQCEEPAARDRSCILPANSNSFKVCENKKWLTEGEKTNMNNMSETNILYFPMFSHIFPYFSSHFIQHVVHRRNDDWDAARGGLRHIQQTIFCLSPAICASDAQQKT